MGLPMCFVLGRPARVADTKNMSARHMSVCHEEAEGYHKLCSMVAQS